jgi:hypothetical protein
MVDIFFTILGVAAALLIGAALIVVAILVRQDRRDRRIRAQLLEDIKARRTQERARS